MLDGPALGNRAAPGDQLVNVVQAQSNRCIEQIALADGRRMPRYGIAVVQTRPIPYGWPLPDEPEVLLVGGLSDRCWATMNSLEGQIH